MNPFICEWSCFRRIMSSCGSTFWVVCSMASNIIAISSSYSSSFSSIFFRSFCSDWRRFSLSFSTSCLSFFTSFKWVSSVICNFSSSVCSLFFRTIWFESFSVWVFARRLFAASFSFLINNFSACLSEFVIVTFSSSWLFSAFNLPTPYVTISILALSVSFSCRRRTTSSVFFERLSRISLAFSLSVVSSWSNWSNIESTSANTSFCFFVSSTSTSLVFSFFIFSRVFACSKIVKSEVFILSLSTFFFIMRRNISAALLYLRNSWRAL